MAWTIEQRNVAEFKSNLAALRRLIAKPRGRNSGATDAAIERRVYACRRLVLDHDGVDEFLNASPVIAERWRNAERQAFGLEPFAPAFDPTPWQESESPNEQRADWGEDAVHCAAKQTGVWDNDDAESAVSDVLAYIAHYCDRLGIDPEATFTRGLNSYTGDFEDGPKVEVVGWHNEED